MKKWFKKILRFFINLILFISVGYIVSLCLLYLKQEKFFFNPKTLSKSYKYTFNESYKEENIKAGNNIYLNAIKFKAQNSKGLVLYFHGNSGAIHDWGKRAHLFLNNNYDVLFVDYRGYGKSDGKYTSDQEFLNDAQVIYDFVKTKYNENEIVVLGFSLGVAAASYVASRNNPKSLILNAPFYSWKTLIADEIAPPIPKFLIRYDFPIYKYLETVKCPIQIFHGTRDFLINPKTNSEKLKALFKDKIKLTYIYDANHNNIHITCQYPNELESLLK